MTLTARKLELYRMPGDGEAARCINAAVNKAKRDLRSARPATILAATKEIGRLYHEVVAPVMKNWTKYGALDTEPRNKVAQALVDEAKKLLDLEGYYPELSDGI